MRVIAGEYGSRPLKAVPGINTRPTTDKIKEGMFNLLGGFFEGGRCLDLYGGSGALAIEAVSRGMDEAVITEKNHLAIETIYKNIEITKESEKFTVLKGDNYKALLRFKKKYPNYTFDLVLIDPPYKQQKIEKDINWLDSQGFFTQNTVIMCESDDHTTLNKQLGSFVKEKEKHYGQTLIRMYKKEGR